MCVCVCVCVCACVCVRVHPSVARYLSTTPHEVRVKPFEYWKLES